MCAEIAGGVTVKDQHQAQVAFLTTSLVKDQHQAQVALLTTRPVEDKTSAQVVSRISLTLQEFQVSILFYR